MLNIPDNIYPARGRKLEDCTDLTEPLNISYSRQYLPRKGTETWCGLATRMCHHWRFPTIFTPQGDGNRFILLWFVAAIADSRQYLPRKGTETSAKEVLPVVWFAAVFPTIFTPQGDGNVVNSPWIKQWNKRFPTIFTPQGDGNPIEGRNDWIDDRGGIPDNIYPARGRKHGAIASLTCSALSAFPTIFTPQGDGNLGALI